MRGRCAKGCLGFRIPVPLADDDPDVELDLQAVFNDVYNHAGYDYSIDYDQSLEPALRAYPKTDFSGYDGLPRPS
jgi:hypothetical protein